MNKYQLLPPLTDEERQALKEDIRQRGVQVPVLVDEDGVILDGHHRVSICQELGISYLTEVREGLTETEKRSLVLALNVHRRHLTKEQRRELIEHALQDDPAKSDRSIARQVHASPTTVGTVRKGMEESGQLSKLDSSIGADGKERSRGPRNAAAVGGNDNTTSLPPIEEEPLAVLFGATAGGAIVKGEITKGALAVLFGARHMVNARGPRATRIDRIIKTLARAAVAEFQSPCQGYEPLPDGTPPAVACLLELAGWLEKAADLARRNLAPDGPWAFRNEACNRTDRRSPAADEEGPL